MKSPNCYFSTPSTSRSSVAEEIERCSVFVGHVPEEMNEHRLVNIFSKSVGPVRNVTILRDRFTGRSRHCAYIRFESEEFAKKAMKIHLFSDPITGDRMNVNAYDAKLSKIISDEQKRRKGPKKSNGKRQISPNFVQVDHISSTVEMAENEEKVQGKPLRRNSLTVEAKEIAMREHLEEIESRTFAENKSVFVARFTQDLKEWNIHKHFCSFGKITFIHTFPTAFRVDFANKRMAAIAIRSMNGKEYGETGKIFICDWWSWSVEERRKAKVAWSPEEKRRPPKKRKSSSKSPPRQRETGKSAKREQKRSKPSEGFLPMTKKYLPSPPALFEYLSTSESENEMENGGQTDAAKLAKEFSTKDLPPSERMAAILQLISPKSEGAD